jgi:hypothetical protein
LRKPFDGVRDGFQPKMIGPTDAIIPHYLKGGKQAEGINSSSCMNPICNICQAPTTILPACWLGENMTRSFYVVPIATSCLFLIQFGLAKPTPNRLTVLTPATFGEIFGHRTKCVDVSN